MLVKEMVLGRLYQQHKGRSGGGGRWQIKEEMRQISVGGGLKVIKRVMKFSWKREMR